MKFILTSAFLLFAIVTHSVTGMPSKRGVMVWKHMLPQVADREMTKTVNRRQIGKQFQQQQQQESDYSDAIIISSIKRFRVRRDAAPEQQKDGKTRFFKLCVAVKNGKCIRKKRFGMWNASRGNPDTKMLT